jgi:hypothetical protein
MMSKTILFLILISKFNVKLNFFQVYSKFVCNAYMNFLCNFLKYLNMLDYRTFANEDIVQV